MTSRHSETNESRDRTEKVPSQGRSPGLKAGLVMAALTALLFWLVSLVPLKTAVKIGADEGFELAKATLLLKGHALYTEIWNDQPPLDTVLVKRAAESNPTSPLGPRRLTVGFSLLLLSGVFLAAWRVHGLWVAGLATAWVMASPGYLELSCSVMQEIPALAPMVFGLGLLLSSDSKWRSWLVGLAGVCFAVGLQMKFIGGLYLPLVGFILWTQRSNRTEDAFSKTSFITRRLLFGGSLFTAGLVGGFFLIGWACDDGGFLLQLRQSWGAHFARPQSLAQTSPGDHVFDWGTLWRHWDTTVPALAGMIFAVASKRLLWLVPVVWWVSVQLILGTHKPWWTYYYVHHAVPLGWCAALGLVELWRRGANRPWLRVVVVVFAVAAMVWSAVRVRLQITDIRQSPQTYSALVLTEIARFKPHVEYLFTDEPVYSFHAGIALPPKLGVISLKRFWSGDLTPEGLVVELERVKPGLILVKNAPEEPLYAELLRKEYRLVYFDDEFRLHALRTVAAKVR